MSLQGQDDSAAASQVGECRRRQPPASVIQSEFAVKQQNIEEPLKISLETFPVPRKLFRKLTMTTLSYI